MSGSHKTLRVPVLARSVWGEFPLLFALSLQHYPKEGPELVFNHSLSSNITSVI